MPGLTRQALIARSSDLKFNDLTTNDNTGELVYFVTSSMSFIRPRMGDCKIDLFFFLFLTQCRRLKKKKKKGILCKALPWVGLVVHPKTVHESNILWKKRKAFSFCLCLFRAWMRPWDDVTKYAKFIFLHCGRWAKEPADLLTLKRYNIQ